MKGGACLSTSLFRFNVKTSEPVELKRCMWVDSLSGLHIGLFHVGNPFRDHPRGF